MKRVIIALVVVIIILSIAIYFLPRPAPQFKSPEEIAYTTIEEEMENAIANMTEEEVENALLSQ